MPDHSVHFDRIVVLEKGWATASLGRDSAEHELREAQAEIKRHHQDFEKIRGLVAEIESIPSPLRSYILTDFARQIRNIVG
jgi:hypothetical protein